MVRGQRESGRRSGSVLWMRSLVGAVAVLAIGGSALAQDTGSRAPQSAPPPGLAAPDSMDISEHARKWEAIDHTEKLGRVRKHGTGDRPMVLIPGTGFSGAVFYEAFERYGESATMYAVSLRGTGGTTPLPGDATQWANGEWSSTSAEGIAELLVAQDLRGVVLVAHGNGAQIAWLAAAKQPERVAGIVVLDGYAVHPVPEETEGGRRGMVEAMDARMSGGSDENNERIRRATLGAVAQSQSHTRLVIADNMDTPRAVYRRYMLESQNSDIKPIMIELAKPALIIAALPDNARAERVGVMRERHEQVYADVPNAFIEYFDQTRHFIMLDNPDLLETAMMEFVKALPAMNKAGDDEAGKETP